MPAGGRVVVNDAAIKELARGRRGPVARLLEYDAELVTQEAKRLAPVSPVGSSDHQSGQLRSSIGWRLGEDAEGLYADVRADVDYALFVEVGTAEHDIDSHGDYPLRNPRTGEVFGQHVHHPGTKPQPFLRPAPDVLPRRQHL